MSLTIISVLGGSMQPFMKMKRKQGMSEPTRQVLNRAIDLLHRLSNKKISEEGARRELSATLSAHFLSEGGVEAGKKIRLQLILEEATGVVAQLDRGEIPLYEAIMLVNRIVVSGISKQEPPPIPDDRIPSIQLRAKINPYEPAVEEEIEEDTDFVSQEFDISGESREKDLQMGRSIKMQEKVPDNAPKQSEDDISALLAKVLLNKKQLEAAIFELNDTLQSVGFELRKIEK